MDRLQLVVRVGGQTVALPAETIESVVELDQITPAPLAAPHVAGLAALRSRVLTVIDSYRAIGLSPHVADGGLQAVVVTIDGHSYGLLVDEVEDVLPLVADPVPLAAGIAAGWAAVSCGLVEIDGRSVLMIDPVRLVAGGAAQAA